MVHGNEAVLLLAVLELRELGDPQQLEVVLLGKAQTLSQLAAQRAQSNSGGLQFASATTNSRSFSLAPARSLMAAISSSDRNLANEEVMLPSAASFIHARPLRGRS